MSASVMWEHGPAMNRAPRVVLLINPKITTRRHARFPLSIMTIAAALEDGHDSMLVDGDVDRAADARRVRCRANPALRCGRRDGNGRAAEFATAIEVSRALRAAQPAPICQSFGAAISQRCIRRWR